MQTTTNEINLFDLLAAEETEAEKAERIAAEKEDAEYAAWTLRMFAAGADAAKAFSFRRMTDLMVMDHSKSTRPHGERSRRACRFD